MMSKQIKLFLDDERFPPAPESDWIIVRTVEEAIEFVEQNGWVHFVSFDNDLSTRPDGTPHRQGWEFAEWLINHDLNHGGMPDGFSFYVHSQNPVRRKDIEDRLNRYLEYKRNGR